MNERLEGDRDARVQALSERYAFQLERWAHARTPMWARGAFDTGELVQQTLAEVVQMPGNPESGRDDRLLGRVRQTLYDRVLSGIRAARERASAGVRSVAPPSDGLYLHDAELGADLLAQYEAGLRRLTPIDREAIIGRAELGLPWSQLTELLDKPGVGAARMAVSRALVRLAREMSYERQ
jgi:DNA-directed RNA polymerase specialized sigma24 family protein